MDCVTDAYLKYFSFVFKKCLMPTISHNSVGVVGIGYYCVLRKDVVHTRGSLCHVCEQNHVAFVLEKIAAPQSSSDRGVLYVIIYS